MDRRSGCFAADRLFDCRRLEQQQQNGKQWFLASCNQPHSEPTEYDGLRLGFAEAIHAGTIYTGAVSAATAGK